MLSPPCPYPRLHSYFAFLGPDPNVDTAEESETEFPQTLDDMPGTDDLLNQPLIKVIQLASEELYPPSKWEEISEADFKTAKIQGINEKSKRPDYFECLEPVNPILKFMQSP